MPRCLVIGAGIAGLSAASRLAAAGVEVVVIDKGRAVGGRMATRRWDGAAFDHGAQHFSVRTTGFGAEVERWRAAGVAAAWYRGASRTRPERGVEERHVGIGGMRRIPEYLAARLEVHTGVTVDAIAVGAAVRVESGGGPAFDGDAVIVTPPVPQTLALLDGSGVRWGEWRERLGSVGYRATLAVLARLHESPGLTEGHRAVAGSDVAWIADNHHKGVSPVPAVTVHSTAEFAALHLEDPPERWTPPLLEAASEVAPLDVAGAIGHRWRYAEPAETFDVGAVRLDGAAPVVLAGEVFAGAKVEGAFTSGAAAAALVLEGV